MANRQYQRVIHFSLFAVQEEPPRRTEHEAIPEEADLLEPAVQQENAGGKAVKGWVAPSTLAHRHRSISVPKRLRESGPTDRPDHFS